MKWKYREKKEPSWKRWFAWYPVPMGRYPLDDGQRMVWLEFVYRKFIDSREGSYSYEYSMKPIGDA